MKNEQLKYLLNKYDLRECIPIIANHIYYLKTPVKQRCYSGGGRYRYITVVNEFLIIADHGIKQAIILRCDESDLHWYVLPQWRRKHVLSDALRTGVIREIWPENTSVTCVCEYNEDPVEKRRMTKHLADIAGLQFNDR